MKNEQLVIGKAVGAHGILGEIKIVPITDDIAIFDTLKYFYLNKLKYDVASVRAHSDFILIKTQQITDRTGAERAKGYISVERTDASPLGEGEYYIEDLKGLKIIDTSGGGEAVVKDVFRAGSTFVVEYEQNGKTLMIPYLKQYFFETDIENGFIKADLSNGIS